MVYLFIFAGVWGASDREKDGVYLRESLKLCSTM